MTKKITCILKDKKSKSTSVILFKISALIYLKLIIIINLTTPTAAHFFDEYKYHTTLPIVHIPEKENTNQKTQKEN